MKTPSLLAFALTATLALLPALRSEPAAPAAPATPAVTTPYPLTTCVVSDEALEGGDMGGPVEYTYKEAGKPDRLVKFCCKMCIAKFKKDPAKYLAKIDAAAAAKPAAPATDGGH